MPATALDSAARLAELRQQLVQRFPTVVSDTSLRNSPVAPVAHPSPSSASPSPAASQSPGLRALRDTVAWVEVGTGDGGLAWLAAWTLLALARDPLGRPALWIDTHCTFTPGDLLDLEGKLVVVRPADPHEAHVAADIALRAGSFSLVALEMHRALHPKPLSRLARLALARTGDARTPLLLWGEPPTFVAPPSGVPRTSFRDAIHALFSQLAQLEQLEAQVSHALPEDSSTLPRAPHTTDRLRPLDRAPDRRPPPGRTNLDAARPSERALSSGDLGRDVDRSRYPTRK